MGGAVMTFDEKQLFRISQLLLRLCEGVADETEMQEIRDFASTGKEAVDYCTEFLMDNAYFKLGMVSEAMGRSPGGTDHPSAESLESTLRAMAEDEKTAPTIVIPEELPERELIQKVVREKTVYKVNKFSLTAAIVSIAAMLLIITYVKIIPPAQTREMVAQITDAVGARWASPDLPANVGDHLNNYDGSRHLLKGCVKIEFYTGAEVIIEGPAEFDLKSFESMYLSYGRLYATVPSEASGFTVNTPCSSIVDIGTEFGVKVDFDGTSDLHMFKGRASMTAGIDGGSQSAREVSKGQAVRVDSDADDIQDIRVEPKIFVRHISSKDKHIWRGESFDLVNLATGGDGISRQGFATSIDPRTGRQVQRLHKDREVANTYVPVKWNTFVDGIFIPNGAQTQTVTTQGHLFEECPPTNGLFCSDLTMNMAETLDPEAMLLDGVQYGRPGNPGLFMHANIGVTFDLQQLRSRVPVDSELIFRSKIGIDETAPKDSNADFWVLLDGKVCYQNRNVNIKGLCDTIEIRLRQSDRFLTLIATDGGDPDILATDTQEKSRSTNCDWCIFAEPMISVE